MKNVNPWITTLIIVVAFIAGWFLGKSEWLKGLFTPADGTVCTTVGSATPNDGVYQHGACVNSGGSGDNTNNNQRTTPIVPPRPQDTNTAV